MPFLHFDVPRSPFLDPIFPRPEAFGGLRLTREFNKNRKFTEANTSVSSDISSSDHPRRTCAHRVIISTSITTPPKTNHNCNYSLDLGSLLFKSRNPSSKPKIVTKGKRERQENHPRASPSLSVSVHGADTRRRRLGVICVVLWIICRLWHHIKCRIMAEEGAVGSLKE